MAFKKISMDPETGNPANEESIKTAYFGWSFHFKQPYNERGGLGTSKECGENNWPSSKSIIIFTNSELKYFQTMGRGRGLYDHTNFQIH